MQHPTHQTRRPRATVATLSILALVAALLALASAPPEARAATTYYPAADAGISGGDAVSAALPIGFAFDFYGNTYSDFYVSTNGVIFFGSASTAYTNTTIPNTTAPNNLIGAFWDNLTMPLGEAEILYATIGEAPNRILVVQWTNPRRSGNLGIGAIQALLYEGSNAIVLQYPEVVRVPGRLVASSATIGIENGDGTLGRLYAYNSTSDFLNDGTVIGFTPSGGDYSFMYPPLNELYLYRADTLAPPDPVTLTSPSSGGTPAGPPITFSWEPSPGADSYRLVVSASSTLSTYVVNVSGLTGTSYTSSASFTAGATYYWTVMAYNAGGWRWNDIRTFIAPVNDPPTITNPGATAVLEDGTASVAFTIGDPETAPESLNVTVSSSNQSVVPSAGLALGGSGASRTLDITPAANANGSATITLAVNDGYRTTSTSFSVSVTAVNDAPSFAVQTGRAVLEDAGAQTVAGWVSSTSPGPANEAAQSVSFIVTGNSNPGLFSAGPAVAANGTLTYTPAADANGSATLTLVAKDSGGAANGGQDTSAERTFELVVTAVNDAPSFAVQTGRTVLEDAGAQTVAGWAASILAGPADESDQSVSFIVTGNSNPGLFSIAPALAPDGTLTYTPATDANGSATITVALKDDGGTTGGGQNTSAAQTFELVVTAVNDAPSFAVQTGRAVLEDAGAQTVAGWVSSTSPGPADESGQSVSFIVTGNSNPGLFSAGPAVAANGTLTYTPALNANGSATLTLVAKDSGGVANGGQDTSAERTFELVVTAVNDAPSFAVQTGRAVLEDAGAQTVAGWAASILAGPADESDQSVSFQVTGNSNPGLFSAAPALAPDGTLTYTPAPNANGSATITVALKDDGGVADGGQNTSAPRAFTLSVTAVNDAPVNTVPGPHEAITDLPLVFSAAGGNALSVADLDLGAGSLRLTLSASHGTLSLGRVVGLTFTQGDGTEDAVMTFTGTLANVNAALDGMDFTSDPGYVGPAGLTLLADDQGHTGGGALTDSDSVALTVAVPNQAPAITMPAQVSATYAHGAAVNLPIDAPASIYPAPIAVAGVDGVIRKATVTLVGLSHTFPADLDILLVGPGGQRVLLMSDAGGSTDIVGRDLTFDDQSIAALPSGSRTILSGVYRPTNVTLGGADTFAAPAPAGPYGGELAVFAGGDPNGFWNLYIVDDYAKTDGGALAGGWRLTLSISSNPFTQEDTELVFSSAGGNPMSFADVDAGSSPLQVTLATTLGRLSLGGVGGLSFSAGDGADDDTMTFTGDLAALNAAVDGLRFTPDANASGTAALVVTVSDLGHTGPGGARVTVSRANIKVAAVVDGAPVVAAAATDEDTLSAPISITRNPADGLEVSHFRVSAIAGGSLFRADGVTAVADGAFISAAEAAAGLRFLPAPDSYEAGGFDVRAALGPDALLLGGEVARAVVTVSPVNDQPTLAPLADMTLPEQAAQQTVALAGIGTGAANEAQGLTVTAASSDPGLIPTPSVTYASPDATGSLSFTPAPGRTGVATITVRVTDDGSPARSVERSFVVAVAVLNQPPTLDPIPASTIDEDGGPQSVPLSGIGIGAGDVGQTLSIAVESSNPALVPSPTVRHDGATGALTFTPAANAYGEATITVRVSDDGLPPLTSQRTFTLMVRPVNDPPAFVPGFDEALDDDAGPQQIAGWAVGITPGPGEAGQKVQFILSADKPQLFSTQPALAGNGTLTYTPKPNMGGGVATVTIRAEDDGGVANGGQNASAERKFRISIGAVNVPPAFTLSATALALDEDFAATHTIVATAAPVAPHEQGQTVSYRLSPSDIGFAEVSVDPLTGAVRVGRRANGFGSATISVIADDGQARNNIATQTLALTVRPVNDPPTLDALDDLQLAEDAEERAITLLGIGAGAPNEAQSLTVTATSSNPALIPAPAVSYVSPAGDGVLRLKPVSERFGSALITVRVADNGAPALSVERTFQVTVSGGNDAPRVNFAGPSGRLYAQPGVIWPLAGLTISDDDAGTQPLRVSLQVRHGLLAVDPLVPGGLKLAQISTNGTERVTLNGTLAAINATLMATDGLRYKSDRGFIGLDRLTIEVDDLGGGGGAAQVASRELNITVEPLAALRARVALRLMSGPGLTASGVVREYVVTVVNNGPSAAARVRLTASLPAGARLVSLTAAQGTCTTAGQIACSLGDLGVGGLAHVTFVVADAPARGAATDLGLYLSSAQANPAAGEPPSLGSGYRLYLPVVVR